MMGFENPERKLISLRGQSSVGHSLNRGLCCEIVVSIEDGGTGRLENGYDNDSLAWKRSRGMQLSGHILI